MTELDRPLKQLLRDPHVRVDALWSRIEAARSHSVTFRAPPTRALGFAGALTAVFAFAAFAVIFAVPRAREAWGGPSTHDGPLLRSNGELLHVLDTTGTNAALAVALMDGSRIRLEPGAKLVTERSDGRQLRLALERGKASFDVNPGGARRWIIDAADSSVEVVGTRFSVEREAERVTVAVERGKVAVRGPRVPEGLQSLGQGERLVVTSQPEAPGAPAARANDVSSAEPPAPNMRRLIAAPDAPGPAVGYQSREATADQLLKAADAARATGDYRRAARTLQHFLSRYPGDTRAAIVALTLGRLQLDRLGSPKAAAISFARADRLGLPDAVAEEGAARLVEAYAKSGDKELARAAAARYGRRFPDGLRSANVAAWLDSD